VATILIADDDDASRLLLSTLLEHAEHRVIAVADGTSALEALGREEPDLLVTDLSMPQISGAELIRTARARNTRLRIALYTATTPNAAIRDFMEIYGVLTLITKPAEPWEVLEGVRAALER